MKNNEQGALHNRKERIFFLYRNYLLEGALKDSDVAINGDEYSFTEEQKDFVTKVLDNITRLETKIFDHLPSDWKWDRFNYLERAIILNAAAEILIAENKKAIVINESLEIAKRYCGEKSQPLINGILDKIGE